MLGLAVLGVVVNGWAALKLSRGDTHSEKVIRWHFLEDTLGWVAVLVGACLILLFKWYWIDPLLAVGVAFFVMWNVFKNLRSTLKIFLQAKPDNFDEPHFLRTVRTIEGVGGVHDIHVWSLDGQQAIVSMHVVLLGSSEEMLKNMQIVKRKIQEIAREMNNSHVTTEFEFQGDECHDNCDKANEHR